MAVKPQTVYALSRSLAEAVQAFVAEAPAEWDGGDLGYAAGGLHLMAQEVLDAMESGDRDESCSCPSWWWDENTGPKAGHAQVCVLSLPDGQKDGGR